MYRFDWLSNGLVSRGWCCDEAIVRLMQLCLCSWLAMWKWKNIWWKKKVCRSCFVNFYNNHIYIYIDVTSKRAISYIYIKYITNGKEVNAVENVSIYAHTHIYLSILLISFFIIDHMLIVWAWMLVNELYKEQEWIYSYDVGWFCFVSMKQRMYTIYIHHINTGHNEVISFDLLWKEKKKHIHISIYKTMLSDWSCRWLSFVLKIKPCMSKYELV